MTPLLGPTHAAGLMVHFVREKRWCKLSVQGNLGGGRGLTLQYRDEVRTEPRGAWQLLNKCVTLVYEECGPASLIQSVPVLRWQSTNYIL